MDCRCTVNPPHRRPALKILKTTRRQSMWISAFWFFRKVTKYVLMPKQFVRNKMLKLDSMINTASKRIIIVVRLGNFCQGDLSTWLMKVEHFPQKSTVRSFIYLDQILFHCKLGFANVVKYSPISVPETVINFLRKQVALGRVVLLKIWGRVVCVHLYIVFIRLCMTFSRVSAVVGYG